MLTEITRFQYERPGLRYASDMTEGEWKVIVPSAKILDLPLTASWPRT